MSKKLTIGNWLAILGITGTLLASGYGFYFKTSISMADVVKECEANTDSIDILENNNVQIKNDVAHLVKKTEIMDERQIEMLKVLYELKANR